MKLTSRLSAWVLYHVQSGMIYGIGWFLRPRFIIAGFAAYFIFVPISFRIPSLTSGVAALGTLLVIGLWIELYGANLTRDSSRAA